MRSDSRCLLGWFNEPDSLASSLRTNAPVEPDEHDAWFKERLVDSKTEIFVAEDQQGPIGQLRLQREDCRVEVSVYVDPRGRRRGAGIALLDHGSEFVARKWPNCDLIARVRTENARSMKLFEKAGYVRSETHSDHFVLSKIIG